MIPFIPHPFVALADIGTAFAAVAVLLAGFLGGVLMFVMVVNGYLYMMAMDDVQRAARAKAAIGAAILGGILIATAVNFAPDLVTAFHK